MKKIINNYFRTGETRKNIENEYINITNNQRYCGDDSKFLGSFYKEYFADFSIFNDH